MAVNVIRTGMGKQIMNAKQLFILERVIYAQTAVLPVLKESRGV